MRKFERHGNALVSTEKEAWAKAKAKRKRDQKILELEKRIAILEKKLERIENDGQH